MITRCTTCSPITPQTYKQLARNVIAALDTNLSIKHTPARANYTKFLEYTIYRPTSGLIAKQDVFSQKVKWFPYEFNKNKSELENLPSIKYLQRILDKRVEEFYPKTAKAREYIIESNRLEIDKVKKSKGYNLIDKIKIFFK